MCTCQSRLPDAHTYIHYNDSMGEKYTSKEVIFLSLSLPQYSCSVSRTISTHLPNNNKSQYTAVYNIILTALEKKTAARS